MLIKGKRPEPPKPETVVIPRGDDPEDMTDWLVFTCQAVLDFEEFERLCPMPKPEMYQVTRRNPRTNEMENVVDENSAAFQKALETYSERKMAYMMLKSLGATDGLQWETVNINEPDTWENYQQELKDAGLSTMEMVAIQQGVFNACSMNQKRMDEAFARFIQSQGEAKETSTSQKDVLSNTPNGEPASASESDPQA